jgi:hypothetical protein
VESLGTAEIRDPQGAILIDEDIVWLDIAMTNASGMQILQTL